MAITPYNPLDKINLGGSVADAMLESAIHALGDPEPFNGAGIYAIYYTGDFQAYRPLAAKNTHGKFEAPIYVGKAVPPGTRKGNFGLDAEPGPALYKRLQEHAESITAAEKPEAGGFLLPFSGGRRHLDSLGRILADRQVRARLEQIH
jgi:hypothetical protein